MKVLFERYDALKSSILVKGTYSIALIWLWIHTDTIVHNHYYWPTHTHTHTDTHTDTHTEIETTSLMWSWIDRQTCPGSEMQYRHIFQLCFFFVLCTSALYDVSSRSISIKSTLKLSHLRQRTITKALEYMGVPIQSARIYSYHRSFSLMIGTQ